MSTNYYLYRKIPETTKEKLRSLISEETIYDGSLQEALEDYKPIHIGHSAVGWQFCFDHNDCKYYNKSHDSINAFLEKEITEGGKLVDEYGTEITVEQLWDKVKQAQDGWNLQSYYQYELEKYRRYCAHPQEFVDVPDELKPHRPSDFILNHPDIFSDDEWHLRFADTTDFC